jgi:D-arabinose 1-dehydrogenase-like Zn-dependent alcohol dehydrogenase
MGSEKYKFEGWLANDASAVNGTMQWKEFKPKTWEEIDIDIKVTHCGVCGTDLHALRSGWVGRNHCHWYYACGHIFLLSDLLIVSCKLSVLRRA